MVCIVEVGNVSLRSKLLLCFVFTVSFWDPDLDQPPIKVDLAGNLLSILGGSGVDSLDCFVASGR